MRADTIQDGTESNWQAFNVGGHYFPQGGKWVYCGERKKLA